MKKISLSKIVKASAILLAAMFTLCSCGSVTKSYSAENGMYDYSVREESAKDYAPGEVFDDYGFAFMENQSTVVEETETYVAQDSVTGVTSDVFIPLEKPKEEASRKIIYRSSYDFETKEFEKSVAALEGLCDKYGAYFESSNVYAPSGNSRNAYFTVRVPVKNYRAFTGEASSVGVVIRTSQDNRDVTEQYFDTEARLESAKIREERVLEILKNSAKLDDVLALERELADIRYEIESHTGTLRKFDSLISYATITINICEVKEYVAPKVKTVSFGERLSSSFDDGISEFKEDFEDLIVEVSYNFIPLIIWLFVIVVLIIAVKVIIKKTKKAMNKLDVKNAESVDKSEASSENIEEKK